MRLIAGVVLGVAVSIAITQWRIPVAWIMTRIPPSTHPDCAPRFRTWHHGEVTAEGTLALGGAGCPHTW